MYDLTPEEQAELRWQEFLVNEDRIMLDIAIRELQYELGKAILASPVGKFIYWLNDKLKRYL